MKRLSLALIIAVALFSCAQQAVQKEAPPAPAGQPAAQELVLPDVPIEPPKKEEKKPEVQKPPVTVEKAGEEKYVILNFDDADIDTVISTMGDLLQINYILAPGISGKVTIQSYKKFPVKDLFSIFQSILEMNGLTAVQNKDFYTIMPIDAAKQQPLDVEKGREVKMKLDSSFITQIVPLEFVKASDAVNLLRGLMPRGTDLIVYEPTNLLIVTARPEGIVKFMKIMEAIDIAPTERENIKTFVYYCESGEAKKLVEILKDLYAPKGAAKKPTGPTPQPRPPVSPPGTTPPSQPASSTVVGGTAGELEGDITITAYEDINAIIIKSSPGAYLALVETIKKLDIAPKQVLIEVLIVELTLNDTESLGIEWILKASGDPTALGGYTQKNVTVSLDDTKSGFLQPALTGITSGYFAAIIDPGKFIGIISAFATYGKANVLSSPHILALDNKEAKIEVGDEIPIATGVNTQNVGGTVQTSLVSTGQIQYKTIGTLLTVTPHISDKDNVTLKVNQEFSALGPSVNVGGSDFPGFSTRRAQTTGIVKDGHTLVIGGMIREDTSLTKAGLPFLSKIPILGSLFGSTSHTLKRTELIVLVTPHVVRDQEEADKATKEFQEKVRSIKESIEQIERGNKERELKKADEQGKG